MAAKGTVGVEVVADSRQLVHEIEILKWEVWRVNRPLIGLLISPVLNLFLWLRKPRKKVWPAGTQVVHVEVRFDFVDTNFVEKLEEKIAKKNEGFGV